ncbi:MAG TPA: nitrophenyl compound nitroreductase subunit ArsF family protein [Sunxiuqinia sp.]|nr:nitrophenyl compound nitroreductase subunit ArsF family protein [Sunxiuqinia sp.]
MKSILFSLFLLICSVSFAQTEAQPPSTKIKAYYFHFTERCTTCKAVERVSKDALKTMSIDLKSLNIDKGNNMEIAKKVGANGQALILSNGKETINLTTDGFMYALSNPEKLISKLEAAVNQLKE